MLKSILLEWCWKYNLISCALKVKPLFHSKVVDKEHTDFFHCCGTTYISMYYGTDYGMFYIPNWAWHVFSHIIQSSKRDRVPRPRIPCQHFLSIALKHLEQFRLDCWAFSWFVETNVSISSQRCLLSSGNQPLHSWEEMMEEYESWHSVDTVNSICNYQL